MASGTLWQRARFVVNLVFTVAKRALPQSPAPQRDDAETLIEAMMTGDIAALTAFGKGLATRSNDQGNPWFFTALESGSLTTVQWFLSHGADPKTPDRSGRLPLEAVIQRHALADEFDDHAADCPAMARALLAAGADLQASTLFGQRLADLAKAAGLPLTPS